MSANHGAPLRGLDAARSRLHQGRFGRLFRNLAPASWGATDQENIQNLTELAVKMNGDDGQKDGPDGEESGIPALYTYLGQFIDHDITFDPESTLSKFNDPDGLEDFRTPGLNLDNVYARGPDDQPYMYDGTGHFKLGKPLTGAGNVAHDLPRFDGRAIIGDPRNDENTIVSQLQGLFLQFHNRMLSDLGLGFEQTQRLVTFHYQYMIVNDFLPRFVDKKVLDQLKDGTRYSKKKLAYYAWKNDPYMPVEFSVAAYRLGHSMVRPGYRLNDQTLRAIFPLKKGEKGLTGFKPVDSGMAIDWGRFIDIDQRAYGVADAGSTPDNMNRLQFAYRIDTSLVAPLFQLPKAISADQKLKSLGLRNLLRGWRLELPSGQAVARAMGEPVLDDKDILIGKALDSFGKGDTKPVAINEIANGAFAGNCPLWIYILAEAAQNKKTVKVPASGAPAGGINTPQLGPVGGRIVAEVFLGLLFGDKTSYLNVDPNWHPSTGADFRLKDFVLYALGKEPKLKVR